MVMVIVDGRPPVAAFSFEGFTVCLEPRRTARHLVLTACDLGPDGAIGLGSRAAPQVHEADAVRFELSQFALEQRAAAVKVSPLGLVLGIPHRSGRGVTGGALLMHALGMAERLDCADAWVLGCRD